MVLRLSCFFLFALASCATCAPLAHAASPAEIVLAQAELELALQQLGQFDRVEYPLELRRLEDALRIVEAEIDAIEYRLAEYEPYTRVRYGSPLVTTISDLRIMHLDAQQRYRQLREEKMLLVRLRPAHRAALLAEIAAAEARLALLAE